jgi:hypothetical protein
MRSFLPSLQGRKERGILRSGYFLPYPCIVNQSTIWERVRYLRAYIQEVRRLFSPIQVKAMKVSAMISHYDSRVPFPDIFHSTRGKALIL